MSLVLHNLRVFCRNSLVNFIQKSYCHTLKKETLPRSIYKQLSDEPSEIFTYIEKNQGYLSGQHCIEALQKLRKSSIKFEDINKNDLAKLCNELKRRITSLDASEAVVALSALTKLNVPTQTVIYESLLQIIRSNINSLTIDDVISLQLDLKDATRTPLVEAILIALPTIFEIQLRRIDRSNVNLLAVCLVFATKVEMKNTESICFILDTISNYKDEIPVKAAKFIFKSLRAVPDLAFEYVALLQRVQTVLLQEVSSLNFDDAIVILKTIDNGYPHPFYNEQVVDALVNSVVIENNLDFTKSAEVLWRLEKIGHEQKFLLDYVAMKFLEESDLGRDITLRDLSSFVSAMSMTDYKPVFWDRIQKFILENKYTMTYENLTEFVVHLAILDSYSSKLLGKVLQQNTEIDLMSSRKKRQILKLYQMVKTLHVYDAPCPLEQKLDVLFDWEQYNSRSFPLQKCLEFATGGSEFIETKVGTKLGHFIDHVMVCEKESGKPAAISHKSGKNEFLNYEDCSQKPITFLEDIFIPENHQALLFLDIPPEGYTINTMQLKGDWNSYIKTLEALRCMVIPICSDKWQQLRDKEKIPYLMHAIRLKCTIGGDPL